VKRPIKIIHVETGMNLYGGALQVLYLLKGFAKLGEVKSLLVCPPGSAIGKAAAKYVAGLYSIPIKGDLDLFFIPRLIGLINCEKPDIIHLHSRRGADVLGGLAGRLSGKRCLLTRRVDNPEPRLWAALKYRLYDHVITISRGIREILIEEGVPAGKITCVRSAVDIKRYSRPCDQSWFLREFGLEEYEVSCGVVAQFIQRKGHRFLLEAIPKILSVHPYSRFLLFGKGPLEEEFRAMCRSMGIAEKVIFAGFRDDLDRIMGCLDLLIHPALMEGLGVSLLQAAAAGVPIVGTRAGGIPEIVQDGINGYLIPPSDVQSIAEAVVKVLADRDLALQMGEKGREIAARDFSIGSMVRGNLEVYREMIREGP
jgi:glycosyltransferase involved in cell wall biosynthesis